MTVIRRKKIKPNLHIENENKNTHTKKTPADNKYRWFAYFKTKSNFIHS